MDMSSSYEIICQYLPQLIKEPMLRVSEKSKQRVNEIRIRVNKPVCFFYSSGTSYLNYDGTLSAIFDENSAVIPSMSDIDGIVKALGRYSMHSCSRELSQGFFSIENGIRVGLAGTMTQTAEKTLKYINALNFRIARQLRGCAEQLFFHLFSAGCKSILICGGVNSGKTTLLRDMCRICGERYKVSVIDERGELAASVNGVPTNDIGIQTDVLDGYERADGITSAIRTLSPQILICDEISSQKDADGILYGYGCGVKFIATVHAGSYEELIKRTIIRKIIDVGVFDYAVILDGEGMPGKIREIRRLG